jgi:tryptophanyl-tRNA synthetase
MRPTGRLHLGNFTGALENWVALQGEYENYHMVADWHALTTDCEESPQFHERTLEMVTDWLSAGIDPEKSPVFVQSHIKEHAELHLIFSMLVTVPRLERNPAVKEQIRDLHLEDRVSYGHLGYPVLQAADILIYKATAVPVGEDQVPHVEIAREISRRFNTLYRPVFPEPQALLTSFARLPGIDGNRMSKSVGNTILLSDPSEEVKRKVMLTVTDPLKVRRGDPGRPEVCTVFTYHQKFTGSDVEEIEKGCRSGHLGCVECKQRLAGCLIQTFEPFRERRAAIEATSGYVREVLQHGAERARATAQQTMAEVREAMGLGG